LTDKDSLKSTHKDEIEDSKFARRQFRITVCFKIGGEGNMLVRYIVHSTDRHSKADNHSKRKWTHHFKAIKNWNML